jgi:hypothetical protein
VQEDPTHVAIRGVVPIVADAMSVVGNRLSVGQDRLLRATLTTPAATADLVQRALQKQTTELVAVLSASVSQRPRVLVVVPPEDVKDGIPEADGLPTGARSYDGGGDGGFQYYRHHRRCHRPFYGPGR